MSFYKETEFESNGYNCIVIFGVHGYRCGYVGVPEGHPLYRKEYNEPCSCLPYEDVKDESQGKRGIIPFVIAAMSNDEQNGMRPDTYFNVHGSITFSDFNPQCSDPDDNRWYFGFDCGHAGDENDYETAFKYGLIDEKGYYMRQRFYPAFGHGRFGVHRTLEYCIEECKSLAAQLAEVEKRGETNG